MKPTIQPHPHGYYEQFIGVPTEEERIASLTECGGVLLPPAGQPTPSNFDEHGMYRMPTGQLPVPATKFDEIDMYGASPTPIPLPMCMDPSTVIPAAALPSRRHTTFVPKWASEPGSDLGDMPYTGTPPPSPIRIYFAASFHRQAEVRGCRDELLGILNGLPNIDPLPYFVHGDKYVVKPVTFESCSAWLDEGSQDGTEHHSPAITDPAGPAFHGGVLYKCIEAIKSCDVFIAFTEEPGFLSRGGRHIEMGAALALGKTSIIVGPIESGGYAIPFGDGVPDYVVDRFRVAEEWDAHRVAKWVMMATIKAEGLR